MSKINWQAFLNRWNHLVLAAPGLSQMLPEEVTTAGYLGRPGASETEISQAEVRLGIRLPPSYRAFLQASDGWLAGTGAKSRFFPIQEVDGFAVWFPEMLRGWLMGYQMHSALEPMLDKEVLVYGKAQDTSLVRADDLRAALAVGESDDEAVYLLNPRVIERSGEWEAWFFAAWLPGAVRYRSFGELMQAEYRKVKERVEEEIEHARSASVPGGLSAKLPSLLSIFQKEIAKHSQMADGAMWVLEQYEGGIIEVLKYGEQQVRQIKEHVSDPGEVERALEGLAGELENRMQQAHQAAKQKGMTNTFGDMEEQMRLNSVVEGSRQAMGIIKEFLKEHKAP